MTDQITTPLDHVPVAGTSENTTVAFFVAFFIDGLISGGLLVSLVLA